MSSLKPGFVFGWEGVEEDVEVEVDELAKVEGETLVEFKICAARFAWRQEKTRTGESGPFIALWRTQDVKEHP